MSAQPKLSHWYLKLNCSAEYKFYSKIVVNLNEDFFDKPELQNEKVFGMWKCLSFETLQLSAIHSNNATNVTQSQTQCPSIVTCFFFRNKGTFYPLLLPNKQANHWRKNEFINKFQKKKNQPGSKYSLLWTFHFHWKKEKKKNKITTNKSKYILYFVLLLFCTLFCFFVNSFSFTIIKCLFFLFVPKIHFKIVWIRIGIVIFFYTKEENVSKFVFFYLCLAVALVDYRTIQTDKIRKLPSLKHSGR